MTHEEYEHIKSTFPWTEQVVTVNGMGGLVRVLDNRGNEVSIFAMTKFLGMITRKIAAGANPAAQEQGASAA